jgi:hypothetical protein
MIQMRTMREPFQLGRELRADDLVDCGREVSDVMATIRVGGNLFLVGPQRCGNTDLPPFSTNHIVSSGVFEPSRVRQIEVSVTSLVELGLYHRLETSALRFPAGLSAEDLTHFVQQGLR